MEKNPWECHDRENRPMSRKLLIFLIILVVAASLWFFIRPKNRINIVSPISKIAQNKETVPQKNMITLIATGDVIPARFVNVQVVRRNDFTWPYKYVAELMKGGDLTLINLESPLIKNCPVTSEGMVFCGDPRHVEGLVFAGVDVANLANNHIGNHGQKGIEETKTLLNNNQILVTGISGPVVKEVKGVKYIFLGYNDVESTVDEAKIKTEITLAKNMGDVVVVSFHWGAEYRATPDDRQKYLAHLVVDSGADLVIGNHPHWIQPLEIYKGKTIKYAHGNLVFDQMWSEETRLGEIGIYTFDGKNLIKTEFVPIKIFDYAQPQIISKN